LIRDLYGIAVIPVYEADLSFKERLMVARAMSEAFKTCLKEIYGEENVLIDNENTDSLDTFEKVLSGELKPEEVGVSGKRAGSQSSRIPRIKYIIAINKNGCCEMVFYPYDQMPDEYEGYFGWLKKIADDDRYSIVRLFNRLKLSKQKLKGLLSLFELLFPPQHYPDQVNNARLARQHYK